jgi:hypothetical protein
MALLILAGLGVDVNTFIELQQDGSQVTDLTGA